MGIGNMEVCRDEVDTTMDTHALLKYVDCEYEWLPLYFKAL